MSDARLLMRELLRWVSRHPRTYADAMEAWRSSCPRHTVWEDAQLEGLLRIDAGSTFEQSPVRLTGHGAEVLGRLEDSFRLGRT